MVRGSAGRKPAPIASAFFGVGVPEIPLRGNRFDRRTARNFDIRATLDKPHAGSNIEERPQEAARTATPTGCTLR
jgi:hypothetical protein